MFSWGSMSAEQWFKADFLVFRASAGGQPVDVEFGGCSKKRTGGALLPGSHAGLRLLACNRVSPVPSVTQRQLLPDGTTWAFANYKRIPSPWAKKKRRARDEEDARTASLRELL